MTIQLGQIAPDFEQDSSRGRIRFHDYLGGSWGVLFSHPKDFTPVCTTELAAVARLAPEWAKRNVKVLGLSVDSAENHAGWAKDIEETQGQSLNFPVIADRDRSVAGLYGMVHPEADPSVTVRSVFVIDPNKKVRLTLTYPPSAGRNFAEILRVIDSLQTTDKNKVSTPSDWQPGQPVIISPAVSNEDAKTRFPQGWTELKPYLRMVQLKDEPAEAAE
jgi:alkyl hydroperoxide reductase subunit AhpC